MGCRAIDFLRIPAVISILIDNVIDGKAFHGNRRVRATVDWLGYSMLPRKSNEWRIVVCMRTTAIAIRHFGGDAGAALVLFRSLWTINEARGQPLGRRCTGCFTSSRI